MCVDLRADELCSNQQIVTRLDKPFNAFAEEDCCISLFRVEYLQKLIFNYIPLPNLNEHTVWIFKKKLTLLFYVVRRVCMKKFCICPVQSSPSVLTSRVESASKLIRFIHSGRPCLCFLSCLVKGCVKPMSGYFCSALPFKALLIQ